MTRQRTNQEERKIYFESFVDDKGAELKTGVDTRRVPGVASLVAGQFTVAQPIPAIADVLRHTHLSLPPSPLPPPPSDIAAH